MSREESPTVFSTFPSSSPSAASTFQPRSTVSQDAGSDTAAAHVPDRTLRLHRSRVRERPQHVYRAADSLLVHPLEAPVRHLGRGAVAEPPRDAEAETGPTAVAGRVDRREQQRGPLEVVARRELEFRVEVAPVVGESHELRLPGGHEARRLDGRALWRGVAADELELSVDPLAIEPRKEPANQVRRDARTPPRREERDHLPAAARVRRSEQRSRALAVALVPDGEPQPRVSPALLKPALDRLPLVDEAHEPEYKAFACDADQRGGGG